MDGRVSGTLDTPWREALSSGRELLLAVSHLQGLDVISSTHKKAKHWESVTLHYPSLHTAI